jgi:hypothetical protein
MTGWVVGWLNLLGQVAGVASTEWGLSRMIFSAVAVARPGFTYTNAMQFGLYCGLLVFRAFSRCDCAAALRRLACMRPVR